MTQEEADKATAAMVADIAKAQEGYFNPLPQVAFRAGFIFCREIMARFVEQGGGATTAQSIRANWIPQFGPDPGAPRKMAFSEIATADNMEKGPWTSINPGPNPEAAAYALGVMGALDIPATPNRQRADGVASEFHRHSPIARPEDLAVVEAADNFGMPLHPRSVLVFLDHTDLFQHLVLHTVGRLVLELALAQRRV